MPNIASIRARLAPALRPVRNRFGFVGRGRRRTRFLRDGIEGIAAELRDTVNGHAAILREYGATVGADVSIHGPIYIVNADGDFSNLSIGDRVHLGTAVLIDLADRVRIEDEATLSMRASIITHIDVGPGALREQRPRRQAPVTIGRGAYLGIGATVLHGVTVGEQATIGGHALIDKDVQAGAAMLAPRARLASTPGAAEEAGG